MASLCGRTEDEIIYELRDVIFLDPESNEWQTSDEYLSGNVREKLRAAQSAAERDPAYQVNVEYLKRVQPKDLDASEIEVRLGATWIDPQYIDRFIRDEFHTDFWLIGRQIKAQYVRHASHEAGSEENYNHIDGVNNNRKPQRPVWVDPKKRPSVRKRLQEKLNQVHGSKEKQRTREKTKRGG